jgi:multiple inositol-polyphosphate phosphatase / 2,3-bisphosphoglycerate 3-phosphatase
MSNYKQLNNRSFQRKTCEVILHRKTLLRYHIILVILLIAISSVQSSYSLTCPASKRIFKTIISSVDGSLIGTKTPYEAPENKTIPPPNGYKAVFINYVGRHGARFLTDNKDVSGIQKILSLAEKEGELTQMGIQLKIMTQRFEEIEAGKYSDITITGKEEQEGIGNRMYEHYKNVFKGNGLKVTTTQEVRTQQSARAFLKGLKGYSGKIKESILPDSLDNDLRFYDISAEYKKYKKGEALRIHIDSLRHDSRTALALHNLGEEFFNGNFRKKLMEEGVSIVLRRGKIVKYSINEFADKLYSLYAIQFSIQQEIHNKGWSSGSINFGSFFDAKDLKWLGFIDGAEDFLEKGPAADTLGIQIRDAAPLLADFIKTTENYITKPGSIDANLRFAHAETVSPFATLLGIRIASCPSPSIFQYNKYWQPSKIIPLSANIQWILFKKENHYLLKVLLNEKEAALPIPTNTFPYYDWNKFKEYYLKKLRLIHVNLNENMHKYLLELK